MHTLVWDTRSPCCQRRQKPTAQLEAGMCGARPGARRMRCFEMYCGCLEPPPVTTKADLNTQLSAYLLAYGLIICVQGQIFQSDNAVLPWQPNLFGKPCSVGRLPTMMLLRFECVADDGAPAPYVAAAAIHGSRRILSYVGVRPRARTHPATLHDKSFGEATVWVRRTPAPRFRSAAACSPSHRRGAPDVTEAMWLHTSRGIKARTWGRRGTDAVLVFAIH